MYATGREEKPAMRPFESPTKPLHPLAGLETSALLPELTGSLLLLLRVLEPIRFQTATIVGACQPKSIAPQ